LSLLVIGRDASTENRQNVWLVECVIECVRMSILGSEYAWLSVFGGNCVRVSVFRAGCVVCNFLYIPHRLADALYGFSYRI
jgi:hypothetical protein